MRIRLRPGRRSRGSASRLGGQKVGHCILKMILEFLDSGSCFGLDVMLACLERRLLPTVRWGSRG